MPSASPAFSVPNSDLSQGGFHEMTLNDDRWEASELEPTLEYDSETELELIPENRNTVLMLVVMKGFTR